MVCLLLMKNTHPKSSVLQRYCLQFLQWLETSASEMFLALALAVHLRIRIISQLSETMPWQPETCVYTVWGGYSESPEETQSEQLTWRAGLAIALVAIHQVDAAAVIQAGAAVTLIYLVTADGTHVPWVADAGVGINPILTLAVVARIRVTVVDVLLTQHTSESWEGILPRKLKTMSDTPHLHISVAASTYSTDLMSWTVHAVYNEQLKPTICLIYKASLEWCLK